MHFFIAFWLLISYVAAAKLNNYAFPLGALTGRVVNGHDAQKGEAPFIVTLVANSFYCAGSIIAPNWVLTAAHCLEYENIDVVAGLHSIYDETGIQTRSTTLNNTIKHELWKNGVLLYDIGLVYLPEPFNLNAVARIGTAAAVAKISLPTGKYEETGNGKLFGWGYTDNTGVLPNVLQVLDVNIIGYDECKTRLAAGAPLRPANLCTHTPGTSDGSCNGDSGGPLVRYTTEGAELVGIVSWGFVPCLGRTSPSVYTKVSSYNEWIINHTGIVIA